ncbi:unnamed protein product [Lathyrus oleraceus]
MVSNRVLACSLLVYLVVAVLFDVTGWRSLFLQLIVLCYVCFGLNPNNRIKLKVGFSFGMRKDTDGGGDRDDDHGRAAGTPEQAD